MKKDPLVFATGNDHKVSEVNDLLRGLTGLDVVSLKKMNIFEEIPETGNTLEGNAKQKARYVLKKYGYDCFSEDTGLEIDVLNGAPGVYSARYAGDQRKSEDNIDLVLKNMSGKKNRSARFRTVICLLLDGNEYLFEGTVEGTILEKRKGQDGFGYDPIFMPNGFNLSFAQMTKSAKNEISHRGRAIKKLVEFLRKYQK